MHMISKRRSSWSRVGRTVVFTGLAGFLFTACAQVDGLEYDTPPTKNDYRRSTAVENGGGVLGDGGLSIFGGDDKASGGSGSAIPVNSFLWRASLDTLSFMPLASADPFGGVIITDWFAPPESINERFKMTVYILSRSLRSDGLKVAVFRQVRDDSGNWVDGEVSVGTARKLEDGILERARKFRVDGLAE